MKKFFPIVFLTILLFLPENSCAISVKEMKWFDKRAYYLDLVSSQSPLGETVESMIKRSMAIYGVNGSYFGKTKDSENKLCLFPIGIMYFRDKNISVCETRLQRGYLWQTTETGIGFKIPDNPIFSIEAGPILLLDSKFVCSYQGFSKKHWNRKCLRTIIAIKDNRIYFYKIFGNLWETSKYLKKYGFIDVINLDGGSSSYKGARVPNAIVVFSKLKPFYKNYINETGLEKILNQNYN